MNTTIIEEFQQVISERNPENKNIELGKTHLKAFELYSNLVASGIISKRGYCLMTIDQAHLHRYSFNSKTEC